jgi:hypothetical protein
MKTRSRKAHARFNASLGIKPRFEGLPPAKEMGLKHEEWVALIHIRKLYGEVRDGLNYLTIDQCEAKLAEAESCLRLHFPDWTSQRLVQMSQEDLYESAAG